MDNLFNHIASQSPPSLTSGIMIFQVMLILFSTNIANSQSGSNRGSKYNSGVQYSAYGGGKSFPSHDTGYRESTIDDAPESISEGRSAKRNQPQQVLDESMVAQMMNNPDAMKMVLKYLTKQNLNEHQMKWNKMAKSKNNHGKNKHKKNSGKKQTTTARPKVTTTTKKAKPKSPILQITQIKRRNDDVKKNKNKEKQTNKRRPRPPGGDFFDFAQLFQQLSSTRGGKKNNRKKAVKGTENEKKPPHDLSFLFGPPLRNGKPKRRKPSTRPTPPANIDDLNNPQLLGDKPKLQYFGPSDFVPLHPYALPMKQHGPMKLTYMSAQEFPNIPKYGLIPIPRRR